MWVSILIYTACLNRACEILDSCDHDEIGQKKNLAFTINLYKTIYFTSRNLAYFLHFEISLHTNAHNAFVCIFFPICI